MADTKKIKRFSLIVLSVLFWSPVVEAKGIEDNSLSTVINAVKRNDDLIANISFDYIVEYNVSEKWRTKQLEFTKRNMGNNWPEGMELRIPTLEPTLRTGIGIFEGNKFKISSKWTALSDKKVFQDEVVAWNGVKLTELNLKDNIANMSDEVDRREAHLTFDPRNFPLLFVDGQPLYSALTDQNTITKLMGKEEIDGTVCYIIEMTENFITPEGVQKQSRKKCWIAPNKSYRLKKTILYGTESFDSKPLTTTQCDLTEVVKGIWYYSKVTFKSYPLSLPKPDVIEVLEIKNIVINHGLKENEFEIAFPAGCFINDGH